MRWLFRLHRKQALQSKFAARIFTKHLTFPSGFGILFRQGLIDRCKSGCSAAGSVLDWGSRGRRFKSCHSDHAKPFFRWKERLFCNLFDVFKILKTALKSKPKQNGCLSKHRDPFCNFNYLTENYGRSTQQITKRQSHGFFRRFPLFYWRIRGSSCSWISPSAAK